MLVMSYVRLSKMSDPRIELYGIALNMLVKEKTLPSANYVLYKRWDEKFKTRYINHVEKKPLAVYQWRWSWWVE